jgi:predicted ATPase/DNA-binding winged helix-turn-helix (wHTH) protein
VDWSAGGTLPCAGVVAIKRDHIMTVDATAGSGRSIRFGPFELFPAQQLLRDGVTPVALGSRAMDILIVLVERAGELVRKDELMALVWPNMFVEETNLRVNVAQLRRALRDGQNGNRYIITDAGRGYRFVALVTVSDRGVAAPVVASPPPLVDHLPRSLTNVIGRESIIATLSAQLQQRRFITLVGPGGIGKTTVALAVARELAGFYPDGVAFLDLAPLSDGGVLPSAFATALGLSMSADSLMPGLLAHLKDRRMLLVFDSCEHVIEAAAAITEDVSSAAPGVHIMATSREPLRAAGERVHRVPPLDSPVSSEGLTAAAAMMFPGVQLFVERAAASHLNGFELRDADAPVVAEICRRLDGIALAIELAAGCTGAFAIRELAERLDDRFSLLRRGRRTALARHQTLGATLDWSYQLLPPDERTLLQRLAVFVGDFSLTAALAVAGGEDFSQAVQIANLAAKSLIAFDHRAGAEHYRLPDTTRLYALEKLKESGAFDDASRRHAQYYRDLLAVAEGESETRPVSEWVASYARHIDNGRAALNWAFSGGGDASLGVALTVASVSLWVQLSLMSECRAWVERALACVGGETDEAAQARMQLSAALGWSLMFAVGRAAATRTAWLTTLELAERLDNTGYRLRALWGLWVDRLNNGQLVEARDLATRFAAIVRPNDDADLMMADRIMGTSLHFLGEQVPARRHIESMLGRYAMVARGPRSARFQFDQQVTAHYFQARILWLLGFPDQAMRIVAHNIEEAHSIGNALSLGSVLGQGACPIALLSGDLDTAQRHGEMLLDHAGRHGLRLWETWARCFLGVVTVRRGEVTAGIASLRAEIERAGDALRLPRFLFLLGELSACLGEAGDAAHGLVTVDQVIARCEDSGERWYLAEAWRIKGELVFLRGDSDGEAQEHFRRSLALAREQRARAWELRAAIGQARLWRDRERRATVRDDLVAVHGTFTEGFATADVRAAHALLQDLG